MKHSHAHTPGAAPSDEPARRMGRLSAGGRARVCDDSRTQDFLNQRFQILIWSNKVVETRIEKIAVFSNKKFKIVCLFNDYILLNTEHDIKTNADILYTWMHLITTE